MTSTIIRIFSPAKLLRLAARTTRGTMYWSLTILWLLFFVLVLIPIAWLALTILTHR